MNQKSISSRRQFLQKSIRATLAISIVGVSAALIKRATSDDMVWQIDPHKCVQCGRCADYCVQTPSAVKCVHVYDLCGYCDLCGGYFKPNAKQLTTGGENQLCPTGAITRIFIEEPYFEYHIIEELCIGCAKCVKGCGSFGNGSLHLQVRHDLCDNCNECAIARNCPAEAFVRVPAKTPYIFSNKFADKK